MHSLEKEEIKVNKPINPLRKKYLEHIEKQKISGLSIKKYCSEHELVPHKFSYYQTYKIKTKVTPKQALSFTSVKLKAATLDSQKPNKLTQPKIDPIWLGQFIKSLLEVK